MSINTEEPLAYELLTRVIDEFEKAAINSQKREGFLALANAPLTGMETVLDSSKEVLSSVKARRKEVVEDENGFSLNKLSPREIIENRGIQFDEDLLELFGGDDNPVANYLQDCLDCSLRLNFDWQLKPLSLLGPINAFLDEINQNLDLFKERINPNALLSDICWTLNHLKTLCIPDLILILMALKMLLKKYSTNLLKVKLDWTVVLGPLLKFILDGITNLLELIGQVSLAPMECILGGLKSSNRLLKEVESFVSIVNSISPQITGSGSGSIKGFQLNADIDLVSVLKDPAFNNATFLEKLIVPVQDAQNFIKDLLNNILSSLNSLNALVSNGVSNNINILGAILYITDMINLVMVIINLLRLNPGVTDWCTHLQENPELLREQLRGRFGDDLSVSQGVADDGSSALLLKQGPDTVGIINTCVSKRSKEDQQLIQQWIEELQ